MDRLSNGGDVEEPNDRFFSERPEASSVDQEDTMVVPLRKDLRQRRNKNWSMNLSQSVEKKSRTRR